MNRVVRTRLPSGLTVLSEELHDAPVVALQAWVNVGSADEDDNVFGVAHLHEHMLFKGTKRRGVGEIARTVEASGGEINAWTSFDQTVYHVVLAADELGTGVDILADALRNSAFDAEELSREIEVVLEEIRRAQDAPARRVSNALFKLAYQKHPYRRPVLGYEDSVRGLTRERILGFYNKFYRPDQITFVAVGDFRTEALLEEVNRHLGDWRVSGTLVKPPRPAETSQEQLQVEILAEDVKEARLAMAWRGPGMHHADLAAVDALAVILGHGDSSRLYDSVRRRRGLVTDAYCYAYTPRDPGMFMLGAGLRTADMVPAIEALLEEAYRVREQRVTAAELEKAKVIILSESAYQRETVQGLARKLGFFEVVGGDHAFEDAYLRALRALVPEDLRLVAQRYLHDRPVVVAQVPANEAKDISSDQVAQAITHTFAGSKRKRYSPAKASDEVTRVQLENGAVVLMRREESPVVALRAVALGGQRWETASTAGISNLFTSLWGLATESLPTAALAQRVAHLGGSLAAFSGRNTLGLRGEFIADKASEGLEIFCESLLRPQLLAADLERERKVILERIRTREESPTTLAFDAFAETLHPTHSYGLRMGGTEETVQRFTLEDLEAHRARYVSPDKLVVSVIGGFDVEEALDLVCSALESPVTAALPTPLPPDPPLTSARRIHRNMDRKQTHVLIGGLGLTLRDPKRYAMEVLTTILSGQSGRLFMDLRDQQSLAYSVSASNLEGMDPGHVFVHIGTSPDKVAQALAGVTMHLNRLRQEPVTEAELGRAKRYLVGTHAIDLQRGGGRAMLMALNERYAMGYDAHKAYPAAIKAVSVADIQALAQTYLAPERLVEVVVGPALPATT